MNGRIRLLLPSVAVSLLIFATTTVAAVELDPAVVTVRTPDQLKWRDPANKGPNNGISLLGDGITGHYVNITKWNKGNNFSRPHFHANDRLIYILSGTWWNGTGTAFDPPNTVPIRAGSFVTHHAKGVHWDGAKDEDAVLLIIGEGPAASTRVKETEGAFNTLNPAAVTYLTPEQFTWRDPSHKAPLNQVILYGNPAKPGLYITINKFSNGFNRPHYHPSDRFSYVLQGTWWVGTGATFDPNNTVAMRPGTVVTHTKGGIHYDGSKEGDALVLITGIGPASAVQAEKK
jgi:Cupin